MMFVLLLGDRICHKIRSKTKSHKDSYLYTASNIGFTGVWDSYVHTWELNSDFDVLKAKQSIQPLSYELWVLFLLNLLGHFVQN